MAPTRFAPSHKIFRGSVALELAPTETAVTDARPKPQPTVTFTAAHEFSPGAGVGGGGYAWDQAEKSLRVQVTVREMPDVIATLLGYIEKVEFTHHGTQRDKSYRIENPGQAESTRLTLSGGGPGQFIFTLAASDRFMLSTMCFRAFQRQHGGIGAETLMMILRDAYRADRQVEPLVASLPATVSTDG